MVHVLDLILAYTKTSGMLGAEKKNHAPSVSVKSLLSVAKEFSEI